MNIRRFKKNDIIIRIDDLNWSRYNNEFAQITRKGFLSKGMILASEHGASHWDKSKFSKSDWINFKTFKKGFTKDLKFFLSVFGDMSHMEYVPTIQLGTSYGKSVVLSLKNHRVIPSITSTKSLNSKLKLNGIEDLLEKYIENQARPIFPEPKVNIDDYDGSKWIEKPSKEEILKIKNKAKENLTLKNLKKHVAYIQEVENLINTLMDDDKKLDDFITYYLVEIKLNLPNALKINPRRTLPDQGLFAIKKGKTLTIPAKFLETQTIKAPNTQAPNTQAPNTIKPNPIKPNPIKPNNQERKF